MHEPKTIVQSLGLSEAESELLLALLQGIQRVSEIIKQTNLKRPTVYYLLKRLQQRGFIHTNGQTRGGRIQVNPATLTLAANERVKEAKQQEASLRAWLESLQTIYPSSEKPSVAFYEGTNAVRRIALESLYARNKHIDVIAPNNNVFHDLGQAFIKEYISERNTRAITTRSLWETAVEKQTVKSYYSSEAEIRLLPEVMKEKFKTTLFLYDDKAIYLSSLKNAYALVVTSQEHHDFMTALFEGLWVNAKPHAR